MVVGFLPANSWNHFSRRIAQVREILGLREALYEGTNARWYRPLVEHRRRGLAWGIRAIAQR